MALPLSTLRDIIVDPRIAYNGSGPRGLFGFKDSQFAFRTGFANKSASQLPDSVADAKRAEALATRINQAYDPKGYKGRRLKAGDILRDPSLGSLIGAESPALPGIEPFGKYYSRLSPRLRDAYLGKMIHESIRLRIPVGTLYYRLGFGLNSRLNTLDQYRNINSRYKRGEKYRTLLQVKAVITQTDVNNIRKLMASQGTQLEMAQFKKLSKSNEFIVVLFRDLYSDNPSRSVISTYNWSDYDGAYIYIESFGAEGPQFSGGADWPLVPGDPSDPYYSTLDPKVPPFPENSPRPYIWCQWDYSQRGETVQHSMGTYYDPFLVCVQRPNVRRAL